MFGNKELLLNDETENRLYNATTFDNDISEGIKNLYDDLLPFVILLIKSCIQVIWSDEECVKNFFGG